MIISGKGSSNQSVTIWRSLVIRPINPSFPHLMFREFCTLATVCNVDAVAIGRQANVLTKTNVNKRHMKKRDMSSAQFAIV